MCIAQIKLCFVMGKIIVFSTTATLTSVDTSNSIEFVEFACCGIHKGYPVGIMGVTKTLALS